MKLPVTYLLTFSESEVDHAIDSEWHELIRCKDCRFLCPTKDLKMRDRQYCNVLRMYIYDDNYCAWAEKKEGEE